MEIENYSWDVEQYAKPWHDTEALADAYEDGYTQQEIADALGCSRPTITNWMPDDVERGGRGLPYENVVLFSGGDDSMVVTHKMMEEGVCDAVLHLDTTSGVPENQQFVEDVCAEYGWPLEIRRASKTLTEFAKEWGFPKAASHSWAYRYFKEHTLGKFTTELATQHPRYYTGVYQDESSRRMKNVSAREQEAGHGRWTWVAPLWDWSHEDFADYREEHDLPRNPVADDIERSGECYCGAYANRVEELAVLQAEYPDHAEWLLDVEEEVQDEIGTDEDYCWWGSSGMSSDELQELMEQEDDSPLMLCQECEFANEDPDDMIETYSGGSEASA